MISTNTTLKYKPDFERAQKYWAAFWEKELLDRPCAVIWAKKTDTPSPKPGFMAVDDALEKNLAVQDKFFETHDALGEAMPYFSPEFGPDQMAAFLGAPLIKSPDYVNTTWSEKIVTDWKKTFPLEISEENIYWKTTKLLHQNSADYYKDKCLIANIDLHSNIDTLEGLRGAQELLFDIIDTPDLVCEAMIQVRKLYTKIYSDLYEFASKDKMGTISSWLHFYSSGKFNPVQADFICFLNPELFRKIVLPAIEEEVEYLDCSCFHLDGPDALNHIDDILSIKKLNAIQWVPGAGNKPQIQWVELFQKIQNAGKAVIVYGSAEQIKEVHKELKPELVVYELWTDTIKDANDFLDWLKNNT